MTTSTDNHFDGERGTFKPIYLGKFKDRTREIRPAGILTYTEGDNLEVCLRQPSISAPITVPPSVEKFRTFTDPIVGGQRTHYGKINDPRHFDFLTHGVNTNEKDMTAKTLVNPALATNYEQKMVNTSESIYRSNRHAPLGKTPIFNLPKTIDPFKHTFGVETQTGENARDAVNPNKSRAVVELEINQKHDMYVFSHADYEPGEQKNRRFFAPFDKNTKFGVTTPVFHDGRNVRSAMNWLPQKLLEKRDQVESTNLDAFRENHTHQIGKTLDPKKDTRLVGPDHTFGLINTSEKLGAADIIHARPLEKVLRGRDKERAYLASLRSHLTRYNYTVFKTLVDAFKYYDQDKDGFISRAELKSACSRTGFPVADDLLDGLLKECDVDRDGRLNFLEFSNFLCFKESMKLGIKYDPKDPQFEKMKKDNNITDYEFKDEDGRVLLKESDLMPKHNIEGNELVPRTVSNQIDTKIGSWKTTYDIINEAPFRQEPTTKRVYGVPSIRNDLVAPSVKKIQDRKNYGDDGSTWGLLQPSIFNQHGVYERDVLGPRPKEEIRKIFTNIGVELSDELFNNVWAAASAQNPYGEVSVEEFRTVLDEIQASTFPSPLVCT